MSIEENKTVARQFYEQGATGTRDDDLIAADIVYHGPPMLGEVRGREGFKQIMGAFRSAFPGFETTIDDLVAEGDRVAVRHTHHGTQSGEFAGIPPTGKAVEVGGIEILRVRDGRIAEFWHMDDFLGLMQQLGVIPTAAPPGATGAASVWPRANGVSSASPKAHKALVRQFFAAAADFWRTGEVDDFDAVLPPDYVNHTPGIPRGREGFKQAIPLFRAAFPDLRITAEDLLAEGDKVAARVTNRGTHQGEFMGIPPTGKPITVTEMHLYRIADGQLVERWGQWDALGLMQQLGAIPVPGQHRN